MVHVLRAHGANRSLPWPHALRSPEVAIQVLELAGLEPRPIRCKLGRMPFSGPPDLHAILKG